ncbi:MAG: DUF4258 domain-containing protein [Candidatus Zhuqueibacterota bacterium]
MSEFFDLALGDIRDWEIIYRIHATKRMYKRNIEEEDIIFLLENGKIIERYEEDFSFPSVLVNGQTLGKRPMHTVVGIDHKDKNSTSSPLMSLIPKTGRMIFHGEFHEMRDL